MEENLRKKTLTKTWGVGVFDYVRDEEERVLRVPPVVRERRVLSDFRTTCVHLTLSLFSPLNELQCVRHSPSRYRV